MLVNNRCLIPDDQQCFFNKLATSLSGFIEQRESSLRLIGIKKREYAVLPPDSNKDAIPPEAIFKTV